MQRRSLHVLLCLLVLAQPVAGAAASVSMLGASLATAVAMDGHDSSAMEMSGMEMSGMEMSGCHEATPATPDCCDDMDGTSCSMDCGTANLALSQAQSPPGVTGHGAFDGSDVYAAPSRSPNTFLKPPRTS